MIQAIIFDFGGVLVSDRSGRKRLAAFDDMLGWKRGALHARLYSGPAWEAVSTGAISVEAYWQQVGAGLEAQLPPDFRAYCDNFYGEPLDRAAVRLAWRLRQRYKIGLLSNATPLLVDRLAAEPALEGLFDAVVISALVGARKPEPEIYHITCRRLGLPPAHCVLLDDKRRNTSAARAQGLPAIEHHSVRRTEQALRDLGVLLEAAPG